MSCDVGEVTLKVGERAEQRKGWRMSCDVGEVTLKVGEWAERRKGWRMSCDVGEVTFKVGEWAERRKGYRMSCDVGDLYKFLFVPKTITLWVKLLSKWRKFSTLHVLLYRSGIFRISSMEVGLGNWFLTCLCLIDLFLKVPAPGLIKTPDGTDLNSFRNICDYVIAGCSSATRFNLFTTSSKCTVS